MTVIVELRGRTDSLYPVLAVYTGESVDRLSLVGQAASWRDASRVRFRASAGTIYQIAVDNDFSGYGTAVTITRRVVLKR
jgi:hypothetical protein